MYTKVAVSLLDDQASSLVGVAISASLLPPAVNCGLFMMSFVFYKKNVRAGNPVVEIRGEFDIYQETISDEYLDYLQSEFLKGAGISFLLTIANIVLIIVASILMFRLKEVRAYDGNCTQEGDIFLSMKIVILTLILFSDGL